MSALARHPSQASPAEDRRVLPADAPGSAGMPDALAALRAATRDIHAHLDSALPLARGDATLADYTQHLHALSDWLAALDGAVAGPGAPAAPAGWAQRQQGRRERIALDLRDCGGLPAAETSGAAANLPPGRPGFGWGVAYVVEGSQLGGTVLYRRLHERLAPHPLRYLRGDGGASPWPAFTAELRRAVATPAATAAACAGAVAAFGLLVDGFRRRGVGV
ncbi:MAG: biliverdin-producing heme oxygenase [Pseudomonadota bacterium]